MIHQKKLQQLIEEYISLEQQAERIKEKCGFSDNGNVPQPLRVANDNIHKAIDLQFVAIKEFVDVDLGIYLINIYSQYGRGRLIDEIKTTLNVVGAK